MARTRTTNLSPLQLARRVELGESRRAASRAKLLDAAYRLFALHGADAPTIDDVIEEAKVARGTFYNHFKTRDELFRAVADDVATAINMHITPAIHGMADPVERLAVAFRLFVRFAVADEARGWILLRTMPLVGPLNNEMKTFVLAEFTEALETKRVEGIALDQAVDLGLGLQIMTIHRLLADRAPLSCIDEAAALLLRAIGVEVDEAHGLAHADLPPATQPGRAGAQGRRAR